MAVKYYVSQDSRGHEQAPDYSHEAMAVIEIVKKVYGAFNQLHELYALVVNLDDQEAAADLVVITERGIGIVELKHYPGDISQRGTKWYAKHQGKTIKIKAGSANRGFHNPHQQVQTYAEVIREDLLENLPRQRPWLPGRYSEREAFKFATAVCFTNPNVSFKSLKGLYYRSKRRAKQKRWEQFSILKPDGIPTWVAGLRFEVNQGRADHYEAHRLTPDKIMRIVKDLFGAIEWTEIDGLMPRSGPYAYLFLKQDGKIKTPFAFTSDEMTIGRSPECDIRIPREFKGVSNKHAKIKRRINGIVLEDCSRNGTFINGKALTTPFHLRGGEELILGRQEPSKDACLLEFSLTSPEQSATKTY